MKLQAIKILTDENISPKVVAFLRQTGVDVRDVADPLDREVAFFEEQHEQLVKAFLGQYVAMYQGEVIAHHTELTTLITTVRTSQPAALMLFRQVQETLPPTLHFRSPRIVK